MFDLTHGDRSVVPEEEGFVVDADDVTDVCELTWVDRWVGHHVGYFSVEIPPSRGREKRESCVGHIKYEKRQMEVLISVYLTGAARTASGRSHSRSSSSRWLRLSFLRVVSPPHDEQLEVRATLALLLVFSPKGLRSQDTSRYPSS